MKSVNIKVEGMACNGCVSTVTKAIEQLPGIKLVDVSLENGNAYVEFDENEISLDEIKKAIINSGYQAP